MFGIEQHIVIFLLSIGGVEQPLEVESSSEDSSEHRVGVVEALDEMDGKGGALDEVFGASTQFPTQPAVSVGVAEAEPPCCDLKGGEQMGSRRQAPPFGEIQDLGSVSAVQEVGHSVALPTTPSRLRR